MRVGDFQERSHARPSPMPRWPRRNIAAHLDDGAERTFWSRIPAAALSTESFAVRTAASRRSGHTMWIGLLTERPSGKADRIAAFIDFSDVYGGRRRSRDRRISFVLSYPLGP